MAHEWRKTPKFVLRQACLRDLTAGWPAGSFAEAGAGTGTLTWDFLDRGWHGAVQDVAEDTRAGLRAALADYGQRLQVVADLADLPAESVDYLLAFEVLEHIPDDAFALRSWARVLRPGGRVLLSVPAHQRKYSAADRLVGHVRRYERDQLVGLLDEVGFASPRLANYGWPVAPVTRRGQAAVDRLLRRREAASARPYEDRSVDSGVRTHPVTSAAGRLLNERTLRPAFGLQRLTYGREWGDGWVATAVKPIAATAPRPAAPGRSRHRVP